MFIVNYKSLFIGIAIAMVFGSIFAVFHFGIKKGIDFTGGTVIEISYASSTPAKVDVSLFEAKGVKVFATGAKSYKFISQKSYEETGATIATLLNKSARPYVETQVNTVGPTMGRATLRSVDSGTPCQFLYPTTRATSKSTSPIVRTKPCCSPCDIVREPSMIVGRAVSERPASTSRRSAAIACGVG